MRGRGVESVFTHYFYSCKYYNKNNWCLGSDMIMQLELLA